MFTFIFDNDSKVSLYEQLYTEIKNRISSGTMKPGEKLPSKRNLAKQLSISVITIENAACTFIDLKAASNYVNISDCKSASGCLVDVDYLVQEGLLTDKQIVSPKTNENVGAKKVKITYPDKKKTCEYIE